MKREVVFLTVLVCALVVGVRFVSAAVDKHTVGMWFFDEGKGKVAEDSSGNKHHGNFVGEVKWVKGKFGQALEFNNGAVEIPDAESLQLQEFTLEAWVNIPKQPGRHEIVIEKEVGDVRNYVMNIQKDTSLIVGGYTSAGKWTKIIGTTNLTDGKWHHLAVAYDGKKLYIYVNGVEEGNSAEKKPDKNNGTLCIGRHPSWDGLHVTGAVDEVHISNVARSKAEIIRSMEGLLAVDPLARLAIIWATLKQAR